MSSSKSSLNQQRPSPPSSPPLPQPPIYLSGFPLQDLPLTNFCAKQNLPPFRRLQKHLLLLPPPPPPSILPARLHLSHFQRGVPPPPLPPPHAPLWSPPPPPHCPWLDLPYLPPRWQASRWLWATQSPPPTPLTPPTTPPSPLSMARPP